MVATWQRQSLFLNLFFLLLTGAVTFSTDMETLLNLKSSLSVGGVGGGDPLPTWHPDTDPCSSSWLGVYCDPSSARVVSLDLSGGPPLAGSLSPALGNLSDLRSLAIPNHALSGEIPLSLWDLRRLVDLNLHGNNLTGGLPRSVIEAPAIVVLNLSSNALSGEIPAGLIGSGQLAIIDLSNNRFTGKIPMDSSSKCLSLRHLKLSNNQLDSDIPPELGRCIGLRTLLLDGNLLQGRLPPELGGASELRVLDVSSNSLTGAVPEELAGCRKLSVVVLTNSSNWESDFNAFQGGLPAKLLTLPGLQVLWAPRANFQGRLPEGAGWGPCSLRVLHLGRNLLEGRMPLELGAACKNLTFLDLSWNRLVGPLPPPLPVPCMRYFNVRGNTLSGAVPVFPTGSACVLSVIGYGDSSDFLEIDDMLVAFFNIPMWGPEFRAYLSSPAAVVHDFSYNHLTGMLPSFSLSDELAATGVGMPRWKYRLHLNSNMFNGTSPRGIVSNCSRFGSISLDLSDNFISGEISGSLFTECRRLKGLNVAHNGIGGSIGSGIGSLMMLQSLDLSGNKFTGSLLKELVGLKSLRSIRLGRNNVTGEIPYRFGELTSLKVLDVSHNSVKGSIPPSLANATRLEIVLLNNNWLSGEIPASLSSLPNLRVLNVSYNNLTGSIPSFRRTSCDWFEGNNFSQPCLGTTPPPELPSRDGDGNLFPPGNKKPFTVALAISSVVLCVALVAVVVTLLGKRKFRAISSLKGKVVVTFADAPSDLTYENVVRATANFSLGNLIGRGGFGSTYQAELSPGYVVAVKKLSIGRLQGAQQFDAEIRTLGRVRHKNLVTLIGYYVGEAEMFLIYNYLSGGNLETFLRNRSAIRALWSTVHKIALDIAQALAYLHYSCVPRVLHRDIKPSNILLDEKLNAYLSDFGLARLLEVSQTHATTDVAGTFGYVAPEYATTCRVSDKSDVYSFGVVLLELLSGKKSIDPAFSEYGDGFNLVNWARMLIKEGRHSELFSAELWEAGPQENLLQMLKLASSCTVESLSVRPSIKQVLGKLKHLKFP